MQKYPVGQKFWFKWDLLRAWGKTSFSYFFHSQKKISGENQFHSSQPKICGETSFKFAQHSQPKMSSQHGADVDFRCGRRMQSLIPPKFNPKQTKLLPLISSFLLLIYEGQCKWRMMYFLRNCLRMNCPSSGRDKTSFTGHATHIHTAARTERVTPIENLSGSNAIDITWKAPSSCPTPVWRPVL